MKHLLGTFHVVAVLVASFLSAAGPCFGQSSDSGRPIPVPLPPRETVLVASGSGVWQQTTSSSAELIVENKDFIFTGNPALETNDSCVGVFALGPFAKVEVRNCSFTGFRQGVVAQGFEVAGVPTTIGVLRVVDSEINGTRGQGIYASRCDQVKIRRTHLVECGDSTLFDHAIYVQSDCGVDVLVADCAIVAAGSHAVQLRSGGTMHSNFIARCPLGLQVGLGNVPYPGGVFGSVYDNVIVEGKDIGPGLPRGMGIILGNTNQTVLSNNLLWQNAGGDPASLWLNGDGVAGQPGVGVKNTTGSGNRVLNWKHGVRTDGVVTNYTSTTWGPNAAMPDTAPTLVLDTLLGPNWITRLLDRELTAFSCSQAVLNIAP